MKKMLPVFLLIWGFLWSVSSAWAGAEPPVLNGQWTGQLKVPGGEMELIVTIVPLSTGGYYAALDVPKQKVSRMPVEAQVKGRDVQLRIDQAGSRFVGKLSEDGKLMAGTWEQPGLKSELILTRTATSAVNAAFKAAPPYKKEEVIVPNKVAKLRLGATLTMPSGTGPFPAVALVSDMGAQDRDASQEQYRMFAILADYLTRRGFAVLRYDDRGVGQSNGKYLAATTADLVSDAQSALGYLRAHYRVKKTQVGLIGHGEGANIALLAAAQPKGPDFLISLAGYGQPGREVLRQQQVEIMRLIGANTAQVKAALDLEDRMVETIRQTPNNALARAKVGVMLRQNNADIDHTMVSARADQLTSTWHRFYLDFDPAARLGEVKCPVLALNGTDDLQVASGKNLSILSKGLRNSPEVKTEKLANVNHWFQPPVAEWAMVSGQQQPVFSPKALQLMNDWLVKQTQPTVSSSLKSRLLPTKRAPAPDKPRG
ncbi:alpha/beta hydrolase family protein [Hymenobacter guriensis]|uniref:Alpha/beta hydrolase n=1 Tax=Hymenobacter guriensis TaxID=2793065 RepID=A0ABS0L032_9BACT|nr:alpha/beta hydrolase [Hymenobacter guriensis]MBG8553335.1 alpha/beta hydrolase [Hymenobacter guriensis]